MKSFLQFIKFCIVGLSNTLISYVIYSSLTFIGIYYIVSNIIAFIISVLNSFYWNTRFVFNKPNCNPIGKKYKIKMLIKTYISYAGTGLILSNILLYFMVDLWGLSPYIAPLFNLIITTPLNFLINKFWSFKNIDALGECNGN